MPVLLVAVSACCSRVDYSLAVRNDIFDVRAYGAKGDGKANDTRAIRAAVDACRMRGGGRVIIPAGVYRAGLIDLYSDMELHIGDGATIVSTLDPADFQYEDVKNLGDASLTAQVRSCHARNVKITGNGTIDGQVMTIMFEDFNNGGAGEEHFSMEKWELFRPRAIYFEDVENWEIRDVTVRDSACWSIHPRGCVNGLIGNVRISNPLRAANTDGIDPDSCRRLTIRDCYIETGDDAIAIKTKYFPDSETGSAKYGISSNILITNVTVVASSAAFKIGTETSADCRDIRFVDCRSSGSAQVISVYSRDGGKIEDIEFKGIRGSAYRRQDAPNHRLGFSWWGSGNPIFISADYRTPGYTSPTLVECGAIRGIRISGCDLEGEASAYIVGLPGLIDSVKLENTRLSFVRRGKANTNRLDERPSFAPFRCVPMSAVFADHVSGLVCTNVKVSWKSDRREMWTGKFADLTACPDAKLESISNGTIGASIRYAGCVLPEMRRKKWSDVAPERVGARILAQFMSTPPERYSPQGWRPKPEDAYGIGNGVTISPRIVKLWLEALRYARAYGSEWWIKRLDWLKETYLRAKSDFVPPVGSEDREEWDRLMSEYESPLAALPRTEDALVRRKFETMLGSMDDFGNVGNGDPEAQAEMLRLCVMLRPEGEGWWRWMWR